MPAGQMLKSLRNRRNITVREVEQASRRIADVKGDKRFCISNGWLAQLENGVSEPSICKLFSLSVIYHANFLDLVRLYNVDVDDKEQYEPVADPYLTQLISSHNGNGRLLSAVTDQLATGLMPELDLRSEERAGVSDNHGPNILYGHLGLTDFTMYPMIRPNALLKIDTSQTRLPPKAWRNEFERPVFFIELRAAYACGWCELQGNHLLIIPHQLSPVGVRHFTYPRDAEVVGRVIGYSTYCVELEPQTPEGNKVKGHTSQKSFELKECV